MSDTEKSPLEFKPLAQRGIRLTDDQAPIDDPLPEMDDLSDLLEEDDARLSPMMLAESAENLDESQPEATNETAIEAPKSGLNFSEPAASNEASSPTMGTAEPTRPEMTAVPETTPGPAPDVLADGDSAAEPDYDVNSLGGRMRYAREKLGYSIPAIADHLRIRKVHLTALEAENWDELPGAVYVIGYLRSYGDFLGLDGQELINLYKTGDSGKLPANDLSFPSPEKESRMPKWSLVAATVAAGAVAFGLWSDYKTDQEPVVSNILKAPTVVTDSETASSSATAEGQKSAPALTNDETVSANTLATTDDVGTVTSNVTTTVTAPETGAEANTATNAPAIPETNPETAALANALEDTAEPAVTRPITEAEAEAETAAVPAVVATVGETGEDSATVADTQTAITQRVVPAAEIAAASNATEESGGSRLGISEANAAIPQEAGPAGGDSRITLTGRRDAWIQIKDGAGDVLASRLLRQDDRYHVPDLPGLTLVTGNAGGLEITVDGRPGKSLGPIGGVLRDLSLDPDSLIAQ